MDIYNNKTSEVVTDASQAQEGQAVTSCFSGKTAAAELVFERADIIMVAVLLAVGFAFVRFVLWNTMGLLTTVTILCMLAVFTIYMAKGGIKLGKRNTVLALMIAVFSLVFSLYANGEIKLYTIAFIMVSGAYFVFSSCNDRNEAGEHLVRELAVSLFSIPFSGFGSAPRAVASGSRAGAGKNAKLILIGLVLAAPVTVVVASLLMGADDGVASILKNLLGSITEGFITAAVQIFLGVLVSFYLFGMLYINVRRVNAKARSTAAFEAGSLGMRRIPNMVFYSAVTPVLILYAIFFVSQLRYFMSAFSRYLPVGFTYSSYARQGFFELAALAVINLSILFVMNSLAVGGGNAKSTAFKVYNTVICAFTLVLIATAFSKMYLYISVYGFTFKRLITSWFMVLLAFIFAIIIVKQFVSGLRFWRLASAAVVVMFAVLCFSNVDARIAQLNIALIKQSSSQEQKSELAKYVLTELSDDAFAYVLKNDEFSALYDNLSYEAKQDVRWSMDYRVNSLGRDEYQTLNASSLYVGKALGGGLKISE